MHTYYANAVVMGAGACFKDTLSYTLEISMFNGASPAGKAPSVQGKL